MFLKTAVFIFLINGYLFPVLGSQNGNNINLNNNEKPNKFSKLEKEIASKNKSNLEKFKLKDIPDFQIEKLKDTVKKNKDHFRDNVSYNENSSFDNLFIELLGLFKVNTDKNAMFITKNGIKNYSIGDFIFENYQIKDINLSTKEVFITDGNETKIYKFPKK